MYALLVTATGWTWEYVDEYMTLPRFRELTDYWLRFPPPHLSLSSIVSAFGGKTGSRAASRSDGYEPPEIEPSNDLTQVLSHPSLEGVFPRRKMRVVKIDKTKAN